MRYGKHASLEQRASALAQRIRILSSLRRVVDLDRRVDLTEHQWSLIQSHLIIRESRLLSRLNSARRAYLPYINEPEGARRLNGTLGQLTLDLNRGLIIFDTFLDILTQRHPIQLGMMLAGCDVIAMDAINKIRHPALSIVSDSVSYFQRGFGAAIVREGVPIADGQIPAPMALIQIPYEKLRAKYELTSILHEAGHEIMVRLGLVSVLPNVLRSQLLREGAPSVIGRLFAAWVGEIFPDWIVFASSGSAGVSSIRDILSLPRNAVFRVAFQSHPPPYLRVLLAFEFCRYLWGEGVWNQWEREWHELYPLGETPPGTRRILAVGRKYLPTVARAIFATKLRVLRWRDLSSVVDFSSIAPWAIDRIVRGADSGHLDLKGVSPTAQLAVFRALRDTGKFSESAIDRLMTKWLMELGQKRKKRDRSIEMPILIPRESR